MCSSTVILSKYLFIKVFYYWTSFFIILIKYANLNVFIELNILFLVNLYIFKKLFSYCAAAFLAGAFLAGAFLAGAFLAGA